MSPKSTFLLVLNLSLYLQKVYSFTLIKSVTFEPYPRYNNISKDGAILSTLDYEYPISQSQYDNTYYWNITTNTQKGYALHVSLDDSWGLHANYNSSIQVTIDGTSEWETDNDLDIFVAFSVNDDQYISTYIPLDNDAYNRIYPECHTSSSSNEDLGSGDIAHEVEDAYNVDNGRMYAALGCVSWYHGTCYQYGDYMYPYYPNIYGHDNSWPFIMTIINYPDIDITHFYYSTEEWLAQYSDDFYQYCIYDESFVTEDGFDIYIAGDDDGESLGISIIKIEYKIDLPTAAPTPEPTTTQTPSAAPSKSPTKNPSDQPSSKPTDPPSQSPSDNPSITPTKSPSNNPSDSPSDEPSESPSADPTVLPSISPSRSPSAPTTPSPTLLIPIDPSYEPSEPPTMNEPIQTSQTSKQHANSNSNAFIKEKIVIIIVIIVSCLFCCLIVACYRCTKRKELKHQMAETNGYVALMDIEESIDYAVPSAKTTGTSLTGEINNKDKDKGSDSDEAIYQYTAPTPGNIDDVDEDRGEDNFDNGMVMGNRMDHESDSHSDDESDIAPEDDLIPAAKDTADDFDQMLQDQCLGNDMMMDDVINDMATKK